MLLFVVCIETVESKLVHLETSRTVILLPNGECSLVKMHARERMFHVEHAWMDGWTEEGGGHIKRDIVEWSLPLPRMKRLITKVREDILSLSLCSPPQEEVGKSEYIFVRSCDFLQN